MGILKRAGLQRGKTLLDYGCGSGNFVGYAREHGVRAEGYDPYSEEFGDPSVLDRSYDFVTAEEVLEHVDDPAPCLISWVELRFSQYRRDERAKLITFLSHEGRHISAADGFVKLPAALC